MSDPTALYAWQQGPGRAATWDRGLPLPGHRSMATVLADERAAALTKGALAFARARKMEEHDNGSA